MTQSDCTIERIETWACRMPLPAPLSFGAFHAYERFYTVLRLHTRNGPVADCIGHTRGSPVDVAIIDVLAPHLLDKDAREIDTRMQELYRATTALERDGVLGRAMSLVEIALWDVLGQSLDAPLWRVLGGADEHTRVNMVEGYAIAGEDDERLAERLIERVGEGFSMLKMEVAHYAHPDQVTRILDRLHKATGGSVEVVCDLAWSMANARQANDAIACWADYPIAWIEDPLPRENVAELRSLRERSPHPIGVGDEATRPADLEALLDARAVDVLRIDPATIGGIGPTMRLVAAAEERNLRVSFHIHPEVAHHCVLATAACDHLEILPIDRPFDTEHELIREPSGARIEQGRIAPPTEPGIGIKLVEDRVSETAYRHLVASSQGQGR